jgi:hypothetical protein
MIKIVNCEKHADLLRYSSIARGLGKQKEELYLQILTRPLAVTVTEKGARRLQQKLPRFGYE